MDEAKRKSGDDLARERFKGIRELGEGRPAIFMEYPTAHYVRVHGVTEDDWGVKMQISCISAAGFGLLGREKKESCPIACSWNAFSADATRWAAQYVSWHLLFEPGIVTAIVAGAEKLHSEGQQLDYRSALTFANEYRAKVREENDSGAARGA